ncbi:MAG TPA: serine protease [Burkholderiales bacterium]|nr:serine protease [Burkholderiales bacterium]
MTALRACSILVGLATSSAALALAPGEVFEKVSPSVWGVRGLDAQQRPVNAGSGVVVANGRVVTSCHVLARARAIQVRRAGRTHEAKLEHADAERDLCLLSVENFDAPAVVVAPAGQAKVGSRVYAIGNADKLGLMLAEGLIAGVESDDPDLPPIKVSAALSAGASGGGVFDDQGRLVGITTLNVARGGIAPNIHFASPAAWLGEVAERARAQLASRAAPAATPASAPSATPSASAAADSWTYRVSGRGLPTGSQEITLASASADEIVEQFFEGGSQRRAVHTKGAYVTPVGNLSLFSPYLATFEKLNPGATLRDVDNRDARTCGPGWSCSLSARVMGRERIKVPAGEFEAIRVQIQQSWIGLSQTNDRGENGGRMLTVWYVPEVKRAVKFSSRGEPSRYIDTHFDVELAGYRLKGR